MAVGAKICGLTTPNAVASAVDGGARFVGFVFFARSPRYLPPDAARALSHLVPSDVRRVGLVVDADDNELSSLVAESGIDVLQLHGSESPERAAAIRARFGLPIIKALAVKCASDLETARQYEGIADWLLFDAPAPSGATRPGGNAARFDWHVLRGKTWSTPWILAGGLTAANVGDAVACTGASLVDVSSGVEDPNGRKSPALIAAFLAEAARAGPA